MASRGKIKSMAKELNLQAIATMPLKELRMGNLEYLEMMLGYELSSRKQNAIAKVKKGCNLPSVKFDKEKLNKGLLYQIEKLLGCDWINKSSNLLIVGEPNTGKTALASYLAGNAIEKGFKAFYIKLDELLVVIKSKETFNKARATYNKIKAVDLLVVDEMLYLDIAAEDLELLYKTIKLINDTASIIFVTNREISKWIKNSEDKYAMELLVKRAIDNCEIVRLNRR